MNEEKQKFSQKKKKNTELKDLGLFYIYFFSLRNNIIFRSAGFFK